MPHQKATKEFYMDVCSTPSLKAVVARYGFEEPVIEELAHGPILKLTKDHWVINLPNRDEMGVDVHFECANNGRLHLHIETCPYEPNLANRPELMAQRQPELELRVQLHEAIRQGLKALAMRGFKAPDAAHRPDNPSANSAGSFESNDDTPEGYAAFVAGVVDAVFPIVDPQITEARARLC